MSTERGRGHGWYDVGWPALAGLVSGVGLVAGAVTRGPAVLLVIFVVIAGSVGLTAWNILDQLGRPSIVSSLRIALISGLGTTVTTGWVLGFEAWGLVAVTVVAVTSPPALRGVIEGSARAARADRRVAETIEMRHEFEEIIAHGFSAATGDDERLG